MSYILVTYGYNQFSLFNIKTSTPTLVDKIKESSFQAIAQKIQSRNISLQKEIDTLILEEEKFHKIIQATEQDLQKEEEVYAEAVRQLEAKKKREEIEQKKKEAKEAKVDPKAAKNKKEEKKTAEKKKPEKKGEKKAEEEPGVDNKPILDLKEKLSKLNDDLNSVTNNKNIYIDKKNKLQELSVIYKKKLKEKANIKIDLIDTKGEKMNIFSKGDIYANEYLVEKTVYELNSFNEPGADHDNDKESKKNTKQDFKKADKKKGEKDKDNKEQKEEPAAVELVLEPVKLDGYCFRSVKEDEELNDADKSGGKDKKGAKKK